MGIVLVAAVLMLVAGWPAHVSAASAVSAPERFADDITALTNHERLVAGLPALERDREVDQIAMTRALDMATLGYFDHFNAAGVGAPTLLDEAQVPHQIVGENIARSTYDADQVVRVVHGALMASDGHRANVLETRFHRVGVGVAMVDGMYYFAMVFID